MTINPINSGLTHIYGGGFYALTKNGRLDVTFNTANRSFNATLKDVKVIVDGKTYDLKGSGESRRQAIRSLADQYHTAKSLDGLFLM